MDLGQYEQYKFAIADFLRRATPATPDANSWRTCTPPLFTRLAEDRFNLVLVGRSFMTSVWRSLLERGRLEAS